MPPPLLWQSSHCRKSHQIQSPPHSGSLVFYSADPLFSLSVALLPSLLPCFPHFCACYCTFFHIFLHDFFHISVIFDNIFALSLLPRQDLYNPMKPRHSKNTLDLSVCVDGIDMSAEAGNLAISSHNNSDPRRIHKSGIFKIKHYIFHIFPDQKPVRPFTDIGGSVVIHLLRHTHHQAIINDLKVLKIFHISSHSAVAQRFFILL